MNDIDIRADIETSNAGAITDQAGLHLFADGSHDPKAGQGGWAFVAYRDGVEIASGCGGGKTVTSNAMEALAVLKAMEWIIEHVGAEPAIIWSDSVHVINGCNQWRHIWRSNGWKKLDPKPRSRKRRIADAETWQAIDAHLHRNPSLTVAWCKGHADVDGNIRADQLAEAGRLSSLQAQRRHPAAAPAYQPASSDRR